MTFRDQPFDTRASRNSTIRLAQLSPPGSGRTDDPAEPLLTFEPMQFDDLPPNGNFAADSPEGEAFAQTSEPRGSAGDVRDNLFDGFVFCAFPMAMVSSLGERSHGCLAAMFRLVHS
ncbi:hypothetical protein [Sphingopyxis sp. NFH-91]|jgi:hypothetical protein|uniref:hypothetical protein n=1 Tax=Sphingopyxis sp. NFH-91 TaxID=2744457 RepID=UPI001F1CB0C0|nr:hypothetical protein [Sphingopyxis sp. NFH-91]